MGSNQLNFRMWKSAHFSLPKLVHLLEAPVYVNKYIYSISILSNAYYVANIVAYNPDIKNKAFVLKMLTISEGGSVISTPM